MGFPQRFFYKSVDAAALITTKTTTPDNHA